jgi:hypothetical protein
MNNEPVAWIDPYDLERLPHHDCWVNGQEHKNSVPLYTHPTKTLTNEEIEEFAYAFQLWQLHNPDKALEGIMDFARAILRKAQEK